MELNHKIIGAGEPIVILHGLFGMLDNWKSIANALAEDFMVVLIDLPNHGKSPALTPHDYPTMAEAVADFLNEHWVYNCYMIGHSMGGKVAMQLALDHPELIKKLIVVDIAPRKYVGGHEEIISAISELDIAYFDNRKDAEEELLKRITDLSVVQFLLKNLSRKKIGGYEWKFHLDNLMNHYQDVLDNVSAPDDTAFQNPTLFIRGGRSTYIVEALDGGVINQLFPDHEIKTIADSGHWVHAEKKDLFLEEVLGFVVT